jgi:hypothetical protein
MTWFDHWKTAHVTLPGGYTLLTFGYNVEEMEIFQRALDQVAGCDVVLVREKNTICIARK